MDGVRECSEVLEQCEGSMYDCMLGVSVERASAWGDGVIGV